jgi:hypothetical protein
MIGEADLTARFFATASLVGVGLAMCAWSGAAAAPTARECWTRVNDSETRLLECIQGKELWRHLAAFQKIADQNPGRDGHANRNTGTPGYLASVNYVAALVKRAGYRVRIQPYRWTHFKIDGSPVFSVGDRTYGIASDWYVARLSASGSLTARVQPVGIDAEGSADGCARSDFANFVKGRIALVQRGACDFERQVANAEAAGAAALFVYNTAAIPDEAGGKEHLDGGAYEAKLADMAGIPVIGVASHALGEELVRQYREGSAPEAHVDIHAEHKSDVDYNLIADSPFGDRNHVVVVDGHLDAIYGAGMLDNASGSTTMLEIALNMAKTKTRNQLRYIWFGGEEIGLLGSRYYTKHLTKHELGRIVFDIDVDVTATPNFDILVADPANAHDVKRFPPNVVPQSKVGNRDFAAYFRSAGIESRNAKFGNAGTDSKSFSLVGVPNSGILTQQDCCKHPWEVAIWGGYPGDYEGKVPGHNGGCVDQPHRWCDNLSNNDPFVLEFVSKAVAAVTFELANDASLGGRNPASP